MIKKKEKIINILINRLTSQNLFSILNL